MNLVATAPNIFIAFCVQPSFFAIFSSLEKKSDKNGVFTTTIAFVLALAIYATIAFLSMYTYGTSIHPDILVNISQDTDVMAYILRVVYLLIASM